MNVSSLATSAQERILVLTPTGRDAATTCAVLQEEGLNAKVCDTITELCHAVTEGGGTAVVAEEALEPPMLRQLAACLTTQPPWSDFPLVILATTGRGTRNSQTVLAELEAITNATVLERPLRKATLVSAVKVALRSRRRQFELRDHLIERERLEQQREEILVQQQHIAETLQHSLLEAPLPNAFRNLEVGTQYVPAGPEAMVGGDFFDAFEIDDRVALVVGDVVGKGLAAASQMAEIKYALRAIVRQYPSPPRALTQLNRYVIAAELARTRDSQTLVAVLLALVDLKTGHVQIAVAGAEPPVLLRTGGQAETIAVNGMPVGVTEKAAYQSTELTLHEGDLLFLATDGITEARKGRDFFGPEGFLQAIMQAGVEPTSEQVGASVIAQARAFSGGSFRDDVCLLVAKWIGSPNGDAPDENTVSPKATPRPLDRNEEFLMRLAERRRPSLDPEMILWDTMSALGSHLNLSSCYYAEIDIGKSLIVIPPDYARDVPSHAGSYSLSRFSPEVIEAWMAGETVSVTDTILDPRTSALYDTVYAPMDVRAFVTAPLVKEGICIGLLSVQGSHPRRWSADDVALVQAVAAQTWLVWDNARLYRRSQQNVQRQRAFLRDALLSVTDGRLCLCDTSADLPQMYEPFSALLPVTTSGGLASVRRSTAEACQAAGFEDARRYDLETAVSEAAMNAAVHAGGGQAQVFLDPAGRVQVRIEDHGKGITDEDLPRAALARGYSTTATLGHGMKMMLQTADRIYLLTGASGTTVVLEQHRVPAPHTW